MVWCWQTTLVLCGVVLADDTGLVWCGVGRRHWSYVDTTLVRRLFEDDTSLVSSPHTTHMTVSSPHTTHMTHHPLSCVPSAK